MSALLGEILSAALAHQAWLGRGFVLGLFGLFGIRTILREVPAASRWAALKLTRRAIARLPERLRETKNEEWSAELDAMGDARILRVVLAASFVRAANRIAAGEGLTGSQRAGSRFASAVSFKVDNVVVLFYPDDARALPDGQVAMRFMATYPGGYSTTGTLSVAPGTSASEIQAAISQRFAI